MSTCSRCTGSTKSSSPLRGIETRWRQPRWVACRVLIAPTRDRNTTSRHVTWHWRRSSSPLRGIETMQCRPRLGRGRRVLIAPTRDRNRNPEAERRSRAPGPHRPYEGSKLGRSVRGRMRHHRRISQRCLLSPTTSALSARIQSTPTGPYSVTSAPSPSSTVSIRSIWNNQRRWADWSGSSLPDSPTRRCHHPPLRPPIAYRRTPVYGRQRPSQLSGFHPTCFGVVSV